MTTDAKRTATFPMNSDVMTVTLRHADGSVHFSDLKWFAKSPMHYEDAILSPRETTRPMRVGIVTDRSLTGGPMPPVYDGDRRGNAWKDFVAKYPDEETLLTKVEYDEGIAAAEAVRRRPGNRLALSYLIGRTQVPLRWEMQGVPFSTRGIDVVGDGWITDLKTTQSAEPDRFMYHARNMLWHAQLACYEEACKQNGIDVSKGVFLVGVESKAPNVATVIRLSPEALADGMRCVVAWIEMLKACEANDHWPGYVQCVVDMPGLDEAPELTGAAFEDEDE